MRKVLTVVVFFSSCFQLKAQSSDNGGSPDLPGDLIINIGSNGLRLPPEDMKIDWWSSKSVGIYYTNRLVISNAFSFYPAVGFGMEKFAYQNNVNLTYNAAGNIVLDTLIGNLGDIKKNKLAVTYLEIPVEIRYFPFKSKDGSGFFIGVGASIGYRIESHQKLRYVVNKNKKLTKERDNFDLNNFRYGFIARIGSRGINGFYRMYLSELFDTNKGPDATATTPFTIGVSINAF